MLSAVSDISVNNVVLLPAPDFNQSLFEFLHVIKHKLGHSVLNFDLMVFVAKPHSSSIFIENRNTNI